MRYQPAEPDSPWDGPEVEEPTDAELFGLWPDPFAGPPDDGDAWLGDLSDAELDVVATSWAAEHPADLGQAGFESGGPLDVLPPDPVLAFSAAGAYDGGLGGLSDDELVGLLGASRRLSSWQAAVELDVVAELDRRRAASGSSRAGEQVSDELAAALTLTGRSADALLCMARDLGRLPAARAGLFCGQIDRAKAGVFAAELAAVSDTVAAAIAMALARAAAGMTTGQLRAELRALVLALEPDALRRRAERGRAEARVETWQEGSGNWGVAGRELPAADAITADKRLTAIARALKDAGAQANMDQLRAAVFVALMTGRDPQALLPAKPRGANPGDAKPVRATPCAVSSGCGCAGGPAGMGGSVNLTMPLATWLGTTDRPGEVAGLGPVDADTCRDLAGRLAAGQAATWCLTLIDAGGRAAAHACAGNGPGQTPSRARSRRGGHAPPGGPRGSPGMPRLPALMAWLASLELQWLERNDCAHRRQGSAYRPSQALRHLIQIRQRTCAYPGCRRQAKECDLDHTVPYHQGGRTCECNLGPCCRRHHQVKQAPGWHLTQPQPGTLTWTTPHGRSYTVRPDRYPV
jgi:hypothetical protein